MGLKPRVNLESKSGKIAPARFLDIVMDSPVLPPLDLVDLRILSKTDHYTDLMARIIPMCQKSDFNEAINVILGDLKKYDRDPYVLNFLAALYIQTNQPDQAELYLNRAMPYASKDLRVLNNRACVFLLKNNPAQALKTLESGLKLTLSDAPEYYYNMALACHRMGDFGRSKSYLKLSNVRGKLKESALLAIFMDIESDSIERIVARLKELVELYPSSLLVHYHYAVHLYFMRDIDRAIYHCVRLIQIDPSWVYGRILFMTFVQKINFHEFKREISKAVLECLSYPGGNITYLTNIWRNQMSFLSLFKKTLDEDVEDFDSAALYFINALSTCDEATFCFLCRGLERLVLKSPPLELILIQVRKIFLNRTIGDHPTLTAREEIFLNSLAQQSFLNEYVHFFDSSENELCAQIKNKAKGRDLTRFEALILLCYQPLPDILKTNMLDPKDRSYFSFFIQSQITDRDREDLIAQSIASITAIHDDVSRKVEQMYMENPYPRWTSVNFSGNTDYLQLSHRRSERGQILVAGCGTGQQALYVALRYKNAHVTALDLSRKSLAYAKRKTEEMGITHIDYVQGDILELGLWDRRFDVIESAGVLHHLANPLTGLNILLKLLKPGGTIMLGLYSEIARKSIIVARDDIAAHDIPPTTDEIRNYRYRVLTEQYHQARELRDRGDFYTMSSCRDLIFHVQESRYTLPQIAQILADCGLIFDGFNLDQDVFDQFDQGNPGQGARFDLALWHVYEQKNPKTFRGMYQFWAKKPL